MIARLRPFGAHLDLVEVEVPLSPDVGETRSAVNTMTAAKHLFVRLCDDEGHVGVGEIVPRPTIYGETVASAWGFVERVLEDGSYGDSSISDAWRAMGRIPGNPSAKAGLELAAWDLLAKRAGVSLTRLHGGEDVVEVDVAGTILFDEPGRMTDIALAAVEEGYRALKVKVGRSPDDDVRAISSIRRAVGPDVHIALDANQQWNLVQARRALAEMCEQDLGIAYVEEPVPATLRGDRELLADTVPIPHAVDESLVDVADALREVRWGISRVFNLKAPRSGFRGCLHLASIAETAGLGVVVGTMRELGPGTAANAHVAAATRASWAELVPATQWVHPLTRWPLPLRDGRYRVGPEPGLGVELDPKALDRFRTGRD